MNRLPFADLAVLLVYIGVVIVLGVAARRRQSDAAGYFLGNRSLPWPLVGVSILATAFSAASLLGGPGEAFEHGLLWLQLQVGDGLAIAVVCWVFLPRLRGRALTTAYGYLDERFGPGARVAGSLLFQLQVLLRTGVLVYGPALAFSTLTGYDLHATIVAVGVIATVYTLLGGITAVVWTDALQLAVVLLGVGLSALVVVQGIPGGWGAAWDIAHEGGRLRVVDPEQSWTSVRSWAGAIFGYGVLSLSVAGTNQQPVQRYLSCRSVGEARRAAVLGWGVGVVVTVVTLMLGVLLYAYYQVHPAELPEGVGGDAVFPQFAGSHLPTPVTGLLVAAIFAAAMSSLDSALNSLATSSVVDLWGRFLRPTATDAQQLTAARWMTAAWGVLGTAAGLYVAGRGQLLSMAVRYVGYFAGPVLGLFLLGFFVPRATGAGALAGVAVAFAGIVAVVNAESWWGVTPPIGGIWIATVGTVLCVVAGAAASRFLGRPVPPDRTP